MTRNRTETRKQGEWSYEGNQGIVFCGWTGGQVNDRWLNEQCGGGSGDFVRASPWQNVTRQVSVTVAGGGRMVGSGLNAVTASNRLASNTMDILSSPLVNILIVHWRGLPPPFIISSQFQSTIVEETEAYVLVMTRRPNDCKGDSNFHLVVPLISHITFIHTRSHAHTSRIFHSRPSPHCKCRPRIRIFTPSLPFPYLPFHF